MPLMKKRICSVPIIILSAILIAGPTSAGASQGASLLKISWDVTKSVSPNGVDFSAKQLVMRILRNAKFSSFLDHSIQREERSSDRSRDGRRGERHNRRDDANRRSSRREDGTRNERRRNRRENSDRRENNRRNDGRRDRRGDDQSQRHRDENAASRSERRDRRQAREQRRDRSERRVNRSDRNNERRSDRRDRRDSYGNSQRRDRRADRRDRRNSYREGRREGRRDARRDRRYNNRRYNNRRYNRRYDDRRRRSHARRSYRNQRNYGPRGARAYGHGHGPRSGHGYFCDLHSIFHYYAGFDPYGWRRASHRGYRSTTGCYTVERVERRRGRRVIVGAQLCTDPYGYAYIRRGSSYVYSYY